MTWVLPAMLVAVAVADQIVKAAVLARPDGRGRAPVAALAADARASPAVRVRVVVARPTVAGRLRVPPAGLVAVWVACFVAAAVAPSAGRSGSALAGAALGAALGGALANLVDVVARGGVVDYLAVGRWPAFNLADAAIVSGVAVAVLAG